MENFTQELSHKHEKLENFTHELSHKHKELQGKYEKLETENTNLKNLVYNFMGGINLLL